MKLPGWVVWRQRKGLSEHVAISVSYLGGSAMADRAFYGKSGTKCLIYQMSQLLGILVDFYGKMLDFCGKMLEN